MELSATAALSGVAGRQFPSFADASTAILETLSERMPASTVVVGGLNVGRAEYRVIECAGDGVPGLVAGLTLPIERSPCMHMVNGVAARLCDDVPSDPVYRSLDMCRTFDLHSYIGAPIELTNGERVGSVCALSVRLAQYTEEDLALVSEAARLLSNEWERVARDVELQRLRMHRGEPGSADELTGMMKRKAFTPWLLSEWQSAYKGTTESYLVVCDIKMPTSIDGKLDDAVVRPVADVLEGEARRTDILGRIGKHRLVAMVVNCKGEVGVRSFCSRVEAAVAGIEHMPVPVELETRVNALASLRTSEDVLRLLADG